MKFTTARNLTGLNGGRSVGKVRIYVPEGYELDDVTVDVGMGALYIEDICARGLQISVGAGEADIDDFQAQDVKFDCGAGRITARGETLQEADIDCGVGEIQYTAIGREEDYNYDIDCGIGEVTCGNGDYSGIGSKKCVDNGAAGEINIDCGVGSVEVRFEAGHENERHNEKIHNEKRHSDEDHNITRH